MRFIELTTYDGMNDTTYIKKVSINPEFIVAIEEDNEHSIVHMSNKSSLNAVESRSEIISMIGGLKQFIG